MAPHPASLLERPEPISVLAEVPDGPPLRFTWRRVEHRVVATEGPERIAPEWWRALPRPSRNDEEAFPIAAGADPAAAAAALGPLAPRRHGPRTRDYYRIEDHEGGRYWVFRDGLYGGEEDEAPGWFLHGVFT